MNPTQWIIVAPGTEAERTVPINGRLLVGRECIGARPERRLIVNDLAVSRDHLELRVDHHGSATLVDLSTNGTRVRGVRVARGEPVALLDGDLIELGGIRLLYRALHRPSGVDLLRSTMATLGAGRLTIVPGDPLGALTNRELEVLALIAQGHSNATIANRLTLSLRTVEAHVRKIMLELNLRDDRDNNRRVHAVLVYLRAHAASASPTPGQKPLETD